MKKRFLYTSRYLLLGSSLTWLWYNYINNFLENDNLSFYLGALINSQICFAIDSYIFRKVK